jgi:hypothetical protein
VATTNITPAMIAASASLPLVALPGGVAVSRFHMPVVATTGAEKQIVRAAANAQAATVPPPPVRTPNAYRETQARLALTYGVPRTVAWSRAGQ